MSEKRERDRKRISIANWSYFVCFYSYLAFLVCRLFCAHADATSSRQIDCWLNSQRLNDYLNVRMMVFFSSVGSRRCWPLAAFVLYSIHLISIWTCLRFFFSGFHMSIYARKSYAIIYAQARARQLPFLAGSTKRSKRLLSACLDSLDSLYFVSVLSCFFPCSFKAILYSEFE